MSALFDLRRRVRNAFASANIGPAVLGLDVSFNEDIKKAFKPHWLLHFRAHVPSHLSSDQRRKLHTCFPASDLIRRPIRATPSDDDLRAIAYTMKPNFTRRQSYDDDRRRPDRSEQCRNTRNRPLRGVERVELAIFLDRIGLHRRLLLHEAFLFVDDDECLCIEAVENLQQRCAVGTPRSGSQVRTPSV